MRFWWSDSWLIDHRQPLHLVLALYVRDAAGLGSVGDPLLPALDPRVPRADLPPVDVETAREQWARWWRQCWLRDEPMILRELGQPGLPAFEKAPALQELLRHLLEPAGRWSSERDEEHFDDLVGQTHLSSTDPLGNVVRHRERQLGRRARPFRLTITELPLAGKAGWRLSPEAVVVTRDLVRDRDAFLAFVRPAVEAVA
jgi:hypothetical protein